MQVSPDVQQQHVVRYEDIGWTEVSSKLGV